MARVIAGTTVSLDGFVQDADGSASALHPDLEDLRDSACTKAMQDGTGAVLMGHRTFGMAGDPDGYADTYELQVPISVVTHTPTGRPGAQRAAVLHVRSRPRRVRRRAAGPRLFEDTGPLALEERGVDEVGARPSLRFRVVRA